MSFREEVKGKQVLVFGLGLQGGGLGDAKWLQANGAKVRVTDRKTKAELAEALRDLPAEIETTLGQHSKADLDWADLIIKNPGVPDSQELILYAKGKGIPVLTSIAVFVRESREKVIGVTGTRGKSTTTELIYQVLNTAYPKQVIRGGNIPGTSGLSLLDSLDSAKYAVLELSSFQLHNFHSLKVSPHLAVITNLYPDHLNRYPSLAEYADDKRAIAAYQYPSDFIIVNQENQGALEIASSSPASHLEYKTSDVPADWSILIPGEHNRSNIAAVLAVAKTLKIDLELVKKVVESFHGLPFRLENRGTKNGITYLNDTTASTPTAASIAIQAMSGPTCIIVGGQSKNLPLDSFINALVTSSQIKKIVIFGAKGLPEFTAQLKASCPEKIVGQVDSMLEAVTLASRSLQKGGTVLLSPGFTSFDLFNNEFERGRQFNQVVENL